VYAFHSRWKDHSEEDRDILIFADNRQQSEADLEARDRILRLALFEFLEKENLKLKVLDTKRLFSEAERIRLYRKQDGQCQMCLAEGLSSDEARVSWSQFQSDHIFPWIRGGETRDWNSQVLCKAHNASKGGRA
jgi:5-methylcytosine-specific restriction endonuclease McrA